jgi:hypothetical protein
MPKWLAALAFAVLLGLLLWPVAAAHAAGSSGFPSPSVHASCTTAACAKVPVSVSKPAPAKKR